LSFQCYKPALLMPENAPFFGEVYILDIGLHPGFLQNISSTLQWIDASMVKNILKPRKKFAHKGDFGHAALAAGSTGMMGAAVLCAKACLRSGAGKLTCHIPSSGNTIMQIAVPEAMCKVEEGNAFINSFSNPEKYTAIGIGPGIGAHDHHAGLLEYIFQHYHHPLVIDADGLNVLAKHNWLLNKIPANTILTPHPKEFERLFGKTNDDFHRLQVALEKAAFYKVIILLKGHYTFIATPGGTGYFNSTGNAGMATGGTGDVLTGIITSLVAQGYEPWQAAVAGAHIHGLAGDLAAAMLSPEALVASDIIDYLGSAFAQLAR
jgi:hydroxyethylthiazole kinase-like uncharacterized protein yjeF